MSRLLAIPLIGLFILAGCDQILTSDATEYPAMLANFSDANYASDSLLTKNALNKHPYVSLSDSVVQVSEEVDVFFTSFGNGCTEKGGVESSVTGLEADLEAYDIYYERNACEDILLTFEHEETLSFDEPGTATITIHGSHLPREDHSSRSSNSFEHEISAWRGKQPFSVEKTIEVVD